MPTIPTPESPTHEIRQVAEGFGKDADRYDRARPTYPDALIRRIVDASPGPDVLDVGCGTGIAARQFQAAGCKVLGVDVDPRMAALAMKQGLDVEVSAIEGWDPAGRTFDAVVAGQTWHWVDPVAGAAKAAVALRPGGRLALFWNVFQFPPALAEALGQIYRRTRPEIPANVLTSALSGYAAMFAAAADGIRKAGAFGDPEEWRTDWERVYTRDEWLDQIPTHGGVNRLPEERLTDLLAGVGAAIDEAGGSFTMAYTTVAVTAVKTA
jgi:SAM-dependent methyltransferase